MLNVNYLLIGHISKDLAEDQPAGFRLGGGVLYSGAAADALGAKVGILTSYPAEMHKNVSDKGLLKKFKIKNFPSRFATTFKNEYKDGSRTQYLYATAAPITGHGYLKSEFGYKYFKPSIVQLAPIAREIDSSVFNAVKADFVGATLQGWLRKRDSKDRVLFSNWPNYRNYLKKLDAAILSEEDIAGDASLAKEFAKYAKVLVLTRGKDGCSVFEKGNRRDFKPVKVIKKNDVTGAGDVFAAGFFNKFYQTKNAAIAAKFANSLAGYHLEKGIENFV
ncbi:MAG TPA: PfkB family carbohydrate kinase [Candidatus Paceibacterota bacterium]|nr:PfkB family carbohydrate kinase [Candidatus Paceibacterota bacterium]HSA37176.1 PfkB family carbohydrate kinase [Candidatus Paceibacterota bacterium]